MAVYAEVLKKGRERLRRAGVPEPELDAWYLFSECFHITRAEYLLKQKETIKEKENEAEEKWEMFLCRREKREPLQYILGVQEFMGLPFFVSPAVLIPRQDTETLVEKALSILNPGDNILDLCTGSGCILLSLMKIGKLTRGTGTDLSKEALLIAGKNADYLKVPAVFYESDLFCALKKEEPFDMIVSNPPYITEQEMKELMPEVAEHEPVLALFGGRDGLDFYRRIAGSAKEFLKPGGSLLMEIGCRQAKDVRRILQENGYEAIEIVQDLAGLDRVVTGKNRKINR